jgi:hypothetical protein
VPTSFAPFAGWATSWVRTDSSDADSLQCTRLQSLRWRLLRTVCVAALLGLALSGLMSYWQAQHEAEELMDGHLAQSARLLLALVRDNESHLADLAMRLATVRSNQTNLYEPPLEFQIGRADGSLLLRSDDAPLSPLSAAAGLLHHRARRPALADAQSAASLLATTGCRSVTRSNCATVQRSRSPVRRSCRSR